MESSEGTTVYILCHNLIICLYCSNIELVIYTIYLKFESFFFLENNDNKKILKRFIFSKSDNKHNIYLDSFESKIRLGVGAD